MIIPPLSITEPKTRWSYSDLFNGIEYEYIKSFIHRNYSIGYHTHNFYELNIVLGGEGYHYIEKMSCHAQKGCVFLIPPHVSHGYLSTSSLDVYHMIIHRDFLTECFSEFRETPGYFYLFEIEPHLRANYSENMFLTLDDKEIEILNTDIEAIESLENIQQSDIYINAIAKKILCILCALTAQKRGIENNVLEKSPELINIADCLSYIHRNFSDKLTVDFLAKKMHMSRSTFIRQFTKICGCPPHKYIQQYRIKKAGEYIKNSEKSPSRIAQECGFYDVSHMMKHINNMK